MSDPDDRLFTVADENALALSALDQALCLEYQQGGTDRAVGHPVLLGIDSADNVDGES